MGKAGGELRPPGHIGQQVGDANTRQHGVEPFGKRFGLRRGGLLDRRDFQHAFDDGDAG